MIRALDEQAITRRVDAELAGFAAAERRRLGLDAAPLRHWHDAAPDHFGRAERRRCTILLGGLTRLQDGLIEAALGAIGYRVRALPCPDRAALHLGMEYGNRGQCNPTWFTVGNLLKHLLHLRDDCGIPVSRIIAEHVFVTAGACGPCRFGTYATEYRHALRGAGFAGFRVLLFQQSGGLRQISEGREGLRFDARFFRAVLKAVIVGDVVNQLGYRIRPYERIAGSTDRALAACRRHLETVLRRRRPLIPALRRCRRRLAALPVDRLRARPRVLLIGEFWAMTTEGDGNYRLQRFIEEQGGEVDTQPVSSWLLYLLWQQVHDARRRAGLAHRDGRRRGWGFRLRLRCAERLLRLLYGGCARLAGLRHHRLPDMGGIARLAAPHYGLELRGGEGHMEVGKFLHAAEERSAHLVVSVKPFGCMPSSGVSDGVLSSVALHHPALPFCSVETSGDAAINVQSRVQMHLFRARRRAAEEFQTLLAERGWSLAALRARHGSRLDDALAWPPDVAGGTAAALVRDLPHGPGGG